MTERAVQAGGNGAAIGDGATGLTDGEPTVLGAAATLPDQRRRDRRARPARRRHITGPGRPAVPGHDAAGSPDGYSEIEYVFEPSSTNMLPLGEYLRSLWERRQFILALARSDNRKMRSNSALGGLWSVLDPLIQSLLYFVLYTTIRGGKNMDFLPVIIGGFLMFRLALSAMSDGGRSLKQSKGLVLNSTFPRALFPITTVCKGVLMMPPAIAVMVLFNIALGPTLGWSVLMFPLLFALQLVMMVGLALLIATIVVYFKDADNAVQYMIRLMFFITPVIYPVSLLSDNLQAVLAWQPYFTLFASYQAILSGAWPSLWQLAQVALWAVVTLAIGLRVFRRYEHEFAIRL